MVCACFLSRRSFSLPKLFGQANSCTNLTNFHLDFHNDKFLIHRVSLTEKHLTQETSVRFLKVSGDLKYDLSFYHYFFLCALIKFHQVFGFGLFDLGLDLFVVVADVVV